MRKSTKPITKNSKVSRLIGTAGNKSLDRLLAALRTNIQTVRCDKPKA